jgi:hypothetical protein
MPALCIFFPQLKHLHLDDVFILEEAIHRLIVGCTAFQGLKINAICGMTSVHIVLMTIRTFVISGW